MLEDQIPTTKTKVVLDSLESVAAPKGVRFIAAKIRKNTEWQHFFHLHASVDAKDNPKLLTHSRHESVTVLQSDTPLGHRTLAATARTTIGRIT